MTDLCSSGCELAGASDTVCSDASGSEVEVAGWSVSGPEVELADCSISDDPVNNLSLAEVISDDVYVAVDSDGSTSSSSTLSPPSASSMTGTLNEGAVFIVDVCLGCKILAEVDLVISG